MVHKGNVFFVAHLAKRIRRVAGVYNIQHFFKNCMQMYFYICMYLFIVCVINKSKVWR